MVTRGKILSATFVGSLLAAACLAQSWGVGASVGMVDDVKTRVHLDEFHSKDVNLWVDYEFEEKALARVTFGTLESRGVNAGQTATIGGVAQTLPDLKDKIDYLTVGVCYQFWEGYYTSGLFAGIGGYKVRPEDAPPGLEGFRDQRETAFGWHLGVDASFRIISRAAIGVRLTYHNIRAASSKPLVTANAGLSYRF